MKPAGLLGAALLGVMPGLAMAAPTAGSAAPSPLYQEHCASCHGADRLGAMGPALLPQNLGRIKPEEVRQVIAEGRPATQMPGFADVLDAAQLDTLSDWVLSDPPVTPDWTLDDIRASQVVTHPLGSLYDSPEFDADPQNLFVVVETGDHHASVLDGDTFERLARFPTRFALHGGPKYSPDGRYVYFGSRDGWITKFDLYHFEVVAEVRAGINMRNIAVSADGRYVMAANTLPGNLVLFDAHELDPLRVYPAVDSEGHGSRVSAVYAAPPRHSFIAALKDVKEAWEIPWPVAPEPVVATGHMAEPLSDAGLPETDSFEVRRVPVPDYLDDFFFDPEYRRLIGASRGGSGAMVIDLNSGAKLADLPLSGMPHLGSGITWETGGRRVMAIPHLAKAEVSIIDMDDYSLVKTLHTDGPGFFMRSHANSRYAWTDVFFGPNRDRVHVIDKDRLEIVETLIPEPGKTSAHVEFDRNGETLLLSLWERDGAVIAYDADTLEEITRIPMDKPSGKYNVWNKTHYEEGTSH
ncbi:MULTISPECIES: cytochrome D1 domain-containing protein [unclassified Halomonas]|uniref:cytochrome D1 domain-containing protein n=1 Tax=unclassified Halomonas TaxID=2609666 RepID=UPI0028F3E3C5|nr:MULTISPECIES: cytochrome D1 domain-containing protein [unclassified Halomonas]